MCHNSNSSRLHGRFWDSPPSDELCLRQVCHGIQRFYYWPQDTRQLSLLHQPIHVRACPSDHPHYTEPDASRRLYFVYLFVAKFVLSYIWTVSIITLITADVSVLTVVSEQTIIAINAIRLTRSLRLDFLNNTLRQEIGYFDSAEPGSIPGSINRGGNLVTQGISEKLGLAIQATTTFFSAFIVAFAVQWKLTLISLCIVPTILIVVTVCVMIDSGIEQRLSVTWEEADKLAEEVFASIRNAHAFWAFPKLSSKFERIMLDARVLGKNKPPIYAVLFCIQFFCIYAGYGLAFWQGIRMYHRGEIDQPGDVVTYVLSSLVPNTLWR